MPERDYEFTSDIDVFLVDSMGGDHSIAAAAWVSTKALEMDVFFAMLMGALLVVAVGYLP